MQLHGGGVGVTGGFGGFFAACCANPSETHTEALNTAAMPMIRITRMPFLACCEIYVANAPRTT